MVMRMLVCWLLGIKMYSNMQVMAETGRPSDDNHQHESGPLINDIEHPSFLSSSLLSDDGHVDSRNNNHSMTKSLLSVKSHKPEERVAVRVLGPSQSYQTFKEMAEMQCCSRATKRNVSVTPTISSFKEFTVLQSTALANYIKAKQQDLLKNIEKKKERQNEVQELRECVQNLEIKKGKLKGELMQRKPSLEKAVAEAKEKLTFAERELKRSKSVLKNRQSNQKQLSARLDCAKQAYERVLREDFMLSEWLMDHSVTTNFIPSTSVEDNVVIQLQNINRREPEECFYVVLEAVCFNTGFFLVKSVFPEFDGVSSAIQRANEDRNLVQLLKKCREMWLKQKELDEL